MVSNVPLMDAVPRSLANPYPAQQVHKLLSRKYQVATFNWAPSDTAGTNIAQIAFPDVLTALPHNADILSQFRWLISDVSVEVRLNSTPFHLGSLAFSFVPRANLTHTVGSNAYGTFIQRMCAKPFIASASSVNNLTFDLPRLAPTVKDDVHDSEGCKVGLLVVDVLNPLTLAGSDATPSTLTVSIFASLKNPDVSGYGYQPPANSRIRSLVRDFARKQSSVVQEAHDKASTGSGSTTLDATNLLSSVVKSVGTVLNPIEGIASSIAQFAPAFGLSKPYSVATPVPSALLPYYGMNSSHGVFTGEKTSLSPEAGLLDTKVNFLKKNKISDVIGTPSFMGSFSIDSNTATDTALFTYVVSPSVGYNDTVNAQYIPSYCAYVASCFKHYRGGMKYFFQFITSQFTTARVRISHFPSTSAPVSLEDYGGDIVSSIVDIRGDTNFTFTVPYQSPQTYTPVPGYHGLNETDNIDAMDISSTVVFSLVNPVSTPDSAGSTVVYVNIWAAAAEDMEFMTYIGPQSRKPSHEPNFARKQSLALTFAKPFPGLINCGSSGEIGFVRPERVDTIEDMLMRPAIVLNPPGGSDFGSSWAAIPNTTDVSSFGTEFASPLQHFTQLFRYYRGGLRYRVETPTLTTTPTVYSMAVREDIAIKDGASYIDGNAAIVQSTLSPVVDVEVPWSDRNYCRSYYGATMTQDESDPSTVTCFHTSAPTPWKPNRVWISVSDDFLQGYLMPPPVYQYQAPPVPVPTRGKETPAQQSQSKLFHDLLKVST